MPIKAEMRWFYPIDWPQLSNHIRFERAGASVSAAGAHMAKPFAFCRMDGGTMRSVRLGAIIAAARLVRPILKTLLAYGRPGLFWQLPTSTIIPETIG